MKRTLSQKTAMFDKKPERVLVIAESDSCGAAGIQGDVKTILALGGYAMSAVTALTAHGAGEVESIKPIPPSFVRDQIRAAIRDVGADAVKIGFLQSLDIVEAVADELESLADKNIPIIVDPSLISRSGALLMEPDAIAAIKRRLYIHTSVLTPNLKEAELLGVMKIADVNDMRRAADMMRTLGVQNVVLKGGQAADRKELYFVATDEGEQVYECATIETRHTLGAGSCFSSALAVSLAQKMNIFQAVEHSLDFMHQAIMHASGFGHAEGPVDHAFETRRHAQSFHPEDVKVYKS